MSIVPEKGKKYAIAFQNPAWPEIKFNGVAICNGELDGFENPDGSYEQWYGFDIEGEKDVTFFASQDIIAEVK